MKIKVLSHENFDAICYKHGLDDDTLDEMVSQENYLYAFISIIGTPECRKYYLEDETSHWFKREHLNVLNLEFDDVTEDLNWKGHLFKAMTEKQADQCIEFLEKNKGKIFYIHCKAGISRSGAFGRFIFDFYNQDKVYKEEEFEKDNSHIRPNNHVLRLLKRAFYKKHGLFVDENRDF